MIIISLYDVVASQGYIFVTRLRCMYQLHVEITITLSTIYSTRFSRIFLKVVEIIFVSHQSEIILNINLRHKTPAPFPQRLSSVLSWWLLETVGSFQWISTSLVTVKTNYLLGGRERWIDSSWTYLQPERHLCLRYWSPNTASAACNQLLVIASHSYLEILVQKHDGFIEFLLEVESAWHLVECAWNAYHVGDDSWEKQVLLVLVRVFLQNVHYFV